MYEEFWAAPNHVYKSNIICLIYLTFTTSHFGLNNFTERQTKHNVVTNPMKRNRPKLTSTMFYHYKPCIHLKMLCTFNFILYYLSTEKNQICTAAIHNNIIYINNSYTGYGKITSRFSCYEKSVKLSERWR